MIIIQTLFDLNAFNIREGTEIGLSSRLPVCTYFEIVLLPRLQSLFSQGNDFGFFDGLKFLKS